MSGDPKYQRINRLKEWFEQNPNGFTPAELASKTGRHVRTVQRDLLDLQATFSMTLDLVDGRYRCRNPQRIAPVSLDLQQARALLIATRLFLRHSEEADSHAVTALEQLSQSMPQPVQQQIQAAARRLARRPYNTPLSRILQTVTDAWARRLVLDISYRSAGQNRPRRVVVEPYALEPSAAGDAIYIVGHSRSHGGVRTFKIARIVSAQTRAETFTLPADFDIDAHLSSAWGIIAGEGRTVRLRFAPDVAWRVQESRWHPSQQERKLADGGVEVTFVVASTMEVGRWIRSWGDKVEVLEPEDLRAELRDEAMKLAATYARNATSPKPRRASAKR